ncbi:MAG: SUMF1/EgtB/PvdO family nonheme iron enzyme [Verrucomicrobiales bacterium]
MKKTIPILAGRVGILMTLICFIALALPAMAQRYLVVGDPGNPAAPANSGGAAGRGSAARSYRIANWEVTNRDWVNFLNVVATGRVDMADPHGLFDSRMASDPRGGITRQQEGTTITGYEYKTSMSSKPVNFVSYYDALRYCNFHHNEQRDYPGVTEDGAYWIKSPTGEANNERFPRRAGARFWLPNLDEWVKAAYYNPTTNTYSEFPMVPAAPAVPEFASATGIGQCANPGPTIMNFGSSADWNEQNGHVLTVGSCESPSVFGAYDMGGNLRELTETQAATSTNVHVCGGSFTSAIDALKLESLTDGSVIRSDAGVTVGFRLASTNPPPPWQLELSFEAGASSPVHLSFPGHVGYFYRIERSANLKDWTTWLNPIFGSGIRETFDDTPLNGAPAGFYRAIETPMLSTTPG